MELGEYTVGLLFLAGTLGASLLAAAIVVVRRLPRLGGVPRVLAFGLVATTALIVVHLLPGATGLLTREAVLIVALVLLVAVWRLVPQLPGGEPLDAPDPMADSGPVSWAIVAFVAAILGVAVVAEITIGLRTPAEDVDSLTFQLPNIGHWIQEKSFWSVNQFIPLQAHGNYPNNGDLMFLAVMLPFDSDALIRVVDVPFYLLAMLSIYAIGCEIRAPRAAAALAGLVFGALPIVHLATFSGAKTDPIFYAAFGAAVLFMLRYLRLGQTSELVLAGVGLGIAFGTKWYGVTSAAIVIGAFAVALLVQRRGVGAMLRGGGVLVGLTGLFGAIWLIRNWTDSDTPLFPQGVPLLADAPRDYHRACVGFSITDYLGKPDILREYIQPAAREMLGLSGALLVVAWFGATFTALRARRRGEPMLVVGLLVGMTAALTLAWAVTPYTALGLPDRPSVAGPNMRYLVPGLMCGAALAAWWIGRLGRLRLVAEAIVGLAVLEGIRRGFDLPARNWVAGAGLLAVAGATAFALVRLRGRFPQTRYAVTVAVLLALIVAGGLYERQQAYLNDRFSNSQTVIQELMKTPNGGRRVGMSGYYDPSQLAPIWPAFGPRLQNRVEYVGRFVDGQLNEFPDQASWQRRIEERGYEVIGVGHSSYPKECKLPGAESDDDAFARAAGYELIARSAYLNVYRVR